MKPEQRKVNRRIKTLEKRIQRNYDTFNWHGNTAKETKASEAAQFEYIRLTGKPFAPVYNCPA